MSPLEVVIMMGQFKAFDDSANTLRVDPGHTRNRSV